ncbi:MAG: hypothetical protein HYY45_10550 [Deltaproteobacteria bacterium]|nr:hypothetical protein [Deltaproteobacteria bacterium]
MEVESGRLNSSARNGNFAKSKGEARRLIGQKAVKVDGQIVSDVDFEFQGGSSPSRGGRQNPHRPGR